MDEMKKEVKLPKGTFCGGNCSDCRYWDRHKKDSNDRGYCYHYDTYYYPYERQGCLSYEKE